ELAALGRLYRPGCRNDMAAPGRHAAGSGAGGAERHAGAGAGAGGRDDLVRPRHVADGRRRTAGRRRAALGYAMSGGMLVGACIACPAGAAVLILLAGRRPNLREAVTLGAATALFAAVLGLLASVVGGARPE